MNLIFDTNTDGEPQARALVALLASLHPGALPKHGMAASFPAITVPVGVSQVHVRVEETGMGSGGGGNSGEQTATVVLGDQAVDVTLSAEDNPAAGTVTPAEVFAIGAPVAPVMTAAAQGMSYEQYVASGWNDEQMISAGLMVAPVVEAAPSAAAAVFGGTPAPLAPTNGAAPAPNSPAATPQPPPSDAAAVFAATSATPAQSPDNAGVSADTIKNALLDSDGLPWDGRIHASTRNCTATGVWKKKRGVDDTTVTAVTNELRAAVAANKAAEHKPLNAPPPPAAGNVPPPPAAAGNVPPPPPAAPSGPVTFSDVARYAGERNFSAEIVQQVCQKHGLPGLALLTTAPNLCAPILADFKAIP